MDIAKKELIDLINTAIDHGGDYGGPYFININGLEKTIKQYCKKVFNKNVEVVFGLVGGYVEDIVEVE